MLCAAADAHAPNCYIGVMRPQLLHQAYEHARVPTQPSLSGLALHTHCSLCTPCITAVVATAEVVVTGLQVQPGGGRGGAGPCAALAGCWSVCGRHWYHHPILCAGASMNRSRWCRPACNEAAPLATPVQHRSTAPRRLSKRMYVCSYTSKV